MQGAYGGLICILIYALGEGTQIDEFAILTESGIDITTESSIDLQTEDA